MQNGAIRKNLQLKPDYGKINLIAVFKGYNWTICL